MKFKVQYNAYFDQITILKQYEDGNMIPIVGILYLLANEHELRVKANRWKDFREFLDNYDLLSINMIGVSTKMLYQQLLQLGLEEYKVM